MSRRRKGSGSRRRGQKSWFNSTARSAGFYDIRLKRKLLGFETLEERRLLAVQPFPVPLSAVTPSGSLIYQSTTNASIDTAVEVESFTVNLDGAQTISIAVDPAAGLDVAVAVRNPAGIIIGSASAGGQGFDEVVHALAASGAGTYTVDVSSAGNTTGTFNIKLILNSELEFEGAGGPTNDTPATAENFVNSFIPLGVGTASRGAVLGTLPSPIGVVADAEDFESGILDGQWTTKSSQVGGRVQVTSAYGASSGVNALLMDRNPSGTTNLNEATWTVNLAGITDATLSFTHRDYSDEQTSLPTFFSGSANGDGVAISADGVNWYTVLNATNVGSGIWAPVTIDLDAAAAAAGMSLGANFRIKFQQYDESALTADGRGYDAIQITTPAPQEDWYRFDLADGESASLALARLSAGTARSTLR